MTAALDKLRDEIGRAAYSEEFGGYANGIAERVMAAITRHIPADVLAGLLAYGVEREAAGVARGRAEMREDAARLFSREGELLERWIESFRPPDRSFYEPDLRRFRNCVAAILALPDHRPASTESNT